MVAVENSRLRQPDKRNVIPVFSGIPVNSEWGDLGVSVSRQGCHADFNKDVAGCSEMRRHSSRMT